jgi:hypothetical protein
VYRAFFDFRSVMGRPNVYQKYVENWLIYPVLEQQAQALIGLTEKVISQTRRRVLNGEKVPHQDKVFSIFETHTDIIIKGSRDINSSFGVHFSRNHHG